MLELCIFMYFHYFIHSFCYSYQNHDLVSELFDSQRLKAEEKKRDDEFDCDRVKASKLATLIDRQMEKKAREHRKRIAEENVMLSRDQKAFQQYLKDEVTIYLNKNNFNVSSHLVNTLFYS